MSKKLNFSAIFLVILLSIYVKIIGYVYLGEIVSIVYILLRAPKISRELLTGVKLIGLWILVQLISDILNNVDYASSAKGIFAPILMIAAVIMIYNNFLDKRDLLPSLFIGYIIGILIILFLSVDPIFLDNPWKWGIGSTVNFLFAIWFSYFSINKRNIVLIIFTLVFVVISNFFSARSMSGMALFAMIFYLLRNNKKITSTLKNVINSKGGMIKVVVSVFLLVFLLNFVVTIIFTSDIYLNTLDSASKDKILRQSSIKYGALVGGRTEILISAQAFFDRPFIGHGSWAKDSHYIDNYVKISEDLNLSDGEGWKDWSYELGLIPAHSFLMGALVWGGIFAGFFWLFVLGKIIRLFFNHAEQMNYFSILLLINFFWSILFSPFGYNNRWASVFSLAFLFYYERKLNKKNS
ncbi:MAG: hypothetical protein QM541_01080 [Flavobacterium sp.]|nr:hypothetical protein [Flavobacterium sp.]